jgi:hypothetical protein
MAWAPVAFVNARATTAMTVWTDMVRYCASPLPTRPETAQITTARDVKIVPKVVVFVSA